MYSLNVLPCIFFEPFENLMTMTWLGDSLFCSLKLKLKTKPIDIEG
jgi:hypothetical protein